MSTSPTVEDSTTTPRQDVVGPVNPKDMYRDFYFSKGNNFSKFQQVKSRTGATPSPSPSPTTGMMSSIRSNTSTASNSVVPAPGMKTVKSIKQQQQQQPKALSDAPNAIADSTVVVKTVSKQPMNSVVAADEVLPPVPAPNEAHSVTNHYMAFLKNQQELQKFHNLIEHTVTLLRGHVEEQIKNVGDVRSKSVSLLHNVESSSEWNLQSKYTASQLIKDANLSLPLDTLLASGRSAPSTVELQHHVANFARLKQDHNTKTKYQPHKLVVENMLRRLERAVKEVQQCTPEVDTAAIAQVVDHYFVHLEHVMAAPTLQERSLRNDELIAHLTERFEDITRQKEEALDEGDMAQAERHSYGQIEVLEELVTAVIEKVKIVSTCLEENAVNDKVQTNYCTSTRDYATKMKSDQGKLKSRCEDDLKRLYELRKKVETLDDKANTRLSEERQRLDTWLENNSRDQEESWNQVMKLLERIVTLERDRHDVVKLRVEEKQKQEQRIKEFNTFVDVSDAHARLLDSTIKNCECAIHCANVLGDSVDAGFNALHVEFEKLDAELNKKLLEAHRHHHDTFRHLYFGLGDLLLKREKKIEEVDANIQAAHIQQELCTDSLNPNAKKFRDMKSELLQLRETLEKETFTLKRRATTAAEGYGPTEDTLSRAIPDFVSPIEEQEDRRLQQRARMLEYKALSIGNVETVPLKDEISGLKNQLEQSKKLVEQ